MKEDGNGSEAAQGAQRQERQKGPQAQAVGAGFDASAYEAQIAERDERVKELERRASEAAKTAEAAERLKSQIDELRPQADDRKRVIAEQARREKQGEFRKMLMGAYSGRCAATGVDVSEVLQAAHIDPYRGKKSQVVTNGMLLRSDIHLLYDAHLLTVVPEKGTIRVSKQLESTFYGRFDGARIDVPRDPLLRPSDELLEMHMREFESVERRLFAA